MVAIKDMEIPSGCYDCPFAKNEKTNDYGSFCECGILEDYETINLLEHSKHPNCPLVEIEERKHGKWEHDKLFGECAYVCSFCHTIWTSSEIQNMHYCPTCGAEMVGAENG